jgi:gliding motility-associated-like protein
LAEVGAGGASWSAPERRGPRQRRPVGLGRVGRGQDQCLPLAVMARLTQTLKRAGEGELRAAKESAEAHSTAKSQFLANMSHEIRTPLNGVLGMAQELDADQLSPPQKEKVVVIHDSGKSLMALLNDVLDFSKVDAGKLDLEVLDFNLTKLMDDIADSFALRAAEKSIELILDTQGIETSWVKGDPSRIRQIFVNLIGNALKFTPEGEIIIRNIFQYYLPNTFTPNNDGLNDVVMMVGSDIDENRFKLEVFNRWGDIVFSTTNPETAWTGNTYNGAYYCPEGVYNWNAVVISKTTGERFEIQGHLNLIR